MGIGLLVNFGMNIVKTAVGGPDGSTAELAAPSTKSLIDQGITTDGVYWIDVPTVGPTQVYCDLSIDNIGWMLMHSNDRNVAAGSSPPRNSVADFGRFSAFWQGNQGSNESFNFDGVTLTTATTEKLIKHMPYKKIKFSGVTYGDASVDFPWKVGAIEAEYPVAYEADAKTYSKYTTGSVQSISSDGTTTHAQKVTASTSWATGTNAKKALTWNATWSHSYNAGEYLLGFFQTSGPAYGDYNYVFLGGRADRKSLSAALWRNRNPQSGVNYALHNSPTSIHCSLGSSGHRGGGNHHNDSWWIQQDE